MTPANNQFGEMSIPDLNPSLLKGLGRFNRHWVVFGRKVK